MRSHQPQRHLKPLPKPNRSAFTRFAFWKAPSKQDKILRPAIYSLWSLTDSCRGFARRQAWNPKPRTTADGRPKESRGIPEATTSVHVHWHGPAPVIRAFLIGQTTWSRSSRPAKPQTVTAMSQLSRRASASTVRSQPATSGPPASISTEAGSPITRSTSSSQAFVMPTDCAVLQKPWKSGESLLTGWNARIHTYRRSRCSAS
ncbi:MAG: hypothetical protein RI897_583 [Verrucomicrobiota bacterium]